MSVVEVQEEQLTKAFETMNQLRPHLEKTDFVKTIQRMKEKGYHLIGIQEDGTFVALAGYRYLEYLAYGVFLYCDDLIVHERYRKRGYAKILLEFMYNEAKKNGCGSFQLDSSVTRFNAHRQYIKYHMDIISHHFCRKVE
jgi:GNAT superfamily N-acetyltransferase